MSFIPSAQGHLCNTTCTLRAIIALKQKGIQQASTFTAYIDTPQFTGQPETLFQTKYCCISSFYWNALTCVIVQLAKRA